MRQDIFGSALSTLPACCPPEAGLEPACCAVYDVAAGSSALPKLHSKYILYIILFGIFPRDSSTALSPSSLNEFKALAKKNFCEAYQLDWSCCNFGA